MSGAESALEAALIALLSDDAGVRAVLGDPARVRRSGDSQPAYPYIELARHETVPADVSEVAASEHRLDLAILSRNDGGDGARAGLAAARTALAQTGLEMEDWRCVMVAPVFAQVMRSDNGMWRGLLRVRAIMEGA